MKTSRKFLLIGDSVFTALKRLRLKYRHETFGERNAVESFFSRFKKREQRDSGIDFLSIALLILCRAG